MFLIPYLVWQVEPHWFASRVALKCPLGLNGKHAINILLC